MPPSEDASRIDELRQLVALSFATEDFEQIAEKIGIAQETIVELLSERGLEEIWRVAASQQIKVEKLESEYSRRLDGLVALTLNNQSRSQRRIRNFLFTSLSLDALIYIAIWHFKDPVPAFYQLTRHPYWFSLGYLVIGFVVPVSYYLFRRFRRLSEYGVGYDVERRQEFQTLLNEIEEAKKKVDEVLISQGVKPRIREILDAQLNLGFTHHLPKLNFSGLSEVFNSANEVATDAKRQLEFMLTT